MPGRLLEREATLAALAHAVTEAAAGRGSVALVTGEAGIGKTSLIRAFAGKSADRARIMLAACDDLMTPRTLGPLRASAAVAYLGRAYCLCHTASNTRAVITGRDSGAGWS